MPRTSPKNVTPPTTHFHAAPTWSAGERPTRKVTSYSTVPRTSSCTGPEPAERRIAGRSSSTADEVPGSSALTAQVHVVGSGGRYWSADQSDGDTVTSVPEVTRRASTAHATRIRPCSGASMPSAALNRAEPVSLGNGSARRSGPRCRPRTGPPPHRAPRSRECSGRAAPQGNSPRGHHRRTGARKAKTRWATASRNAWGPARRRHPGPAAHPAAGPAAPLLAPPPARPAPATNARGQAETAPGTGAFGARDVLRMGGESPRTAATGEGQPTGPQQGRRRARTESRQRSRDRRPGHPTRPPLSDSPGLPATVYPGAQVPLSLTR